MLVCVYPQAEEETIYYFLLRVFMCSGDFHMQFKIMMTLQSIKIAEAS